MAQEADGRHGWLLPLVQAWLPILTAVGGAVWGVYIYSNQQAASASAAAAQARADARTRLIEAQKPFITKQLDLYFETSTVVGSLLTMPPQTEEYRTAATRFAQLYWSDLGMVEDATVEAAMAELKSALDMHENPPVPPATSAAQRCALQLSHAIRASIEASWGSLDNPGKTPALTIVEGKCAQPTGKVDAKGAPIP